MRFVPVILGSIVFNYYLGSKLQTKKSKVILIIGLAANLILLGIYKYADFAISTMNYLSSIDYKLLNFSLPLAVSFFTFQQIAYLVDSYQDRVSDNQPSNYFLFVLFFPQLIAGPIVHHAEMLNQYQNPKKWSETIDKYFIHGLILIIVGLFKKILIADSLAGWVDPVFLDLSAITMLDAWTGILAYSFQIYFDFSAYSEMAMGLALLFGIKLPINFLSPYQSTSILEFWRTWHITLGRFLRKYLYIPLGGSRKGMLTTVIALSATMLLGGLWHGAGWKFALWGSIHGFLLAVAYIWKHKGCQLPKKLATGLTFVTVVIAWVPFRANSIQDALTYWEAMFNPSLLVPQALQARIIEDVFNIHMISADSIFKGWEILVLLCITYLVMNYPNIHSYLQSFRPTLRNYSYIIVIALISIVVMGRPQTFIYWGF